MNQKDDIIERFGMIAHPEGGAFAETYRSSWSVLNHGGQTRASSTGIYFLLADGEFSGFHRIQSDEMWHFYLGDSLSIYEISPTGVVTETRLGTQFSEGELCQYVVPAGVWFASKPMAGGKHGFSFVGCTVAPGFDFADFELAEAEVLSKVYPQHRELIHSLVHPVRPNCV